MSSTNIIVAGVGGQGSILASHIIAEAAILASEKSGKKINVRVGETFGAAMRGGAVASHVRIGDVYAPLVGRGEATLVLAMEPLEALRIGVQYLAPNGTTIFNDQPLPPVDVKIGAVSYPAVDSIAEALGRLGKKVVSFNATALAVEAGSAKAVSVVMLGAAFASGLLPYEEDAILKTIEARVPAKMLEVNRTAFRLGVAAYRTAV